MLGRRIGAVALAAAFAVALLTHGLARAQADPPGQIFDSAITRCAKNATAISPASTEQGLRYREQASEIIEMQRSGEYEVAIDSTDFLLAHRGACPSLGLELLGELTNAYGLALSELDEHERAIRIFALLEDWPIRDVSDHSPVALKAKYNMALALWGLSRFEESIETLNQSSADHLRDLGPDAPETQSVEFALASKLQHVGRLIEAETSARELLVKQQLLLGRKHPRTLRSQNLLGHINLDLNRTDTAIQLLDAVYAVEEAVLPPDHPIRLAAGNNLANALQDRGEIVEALSIHRNILGVREQRGGPTAAATLVSLHNVARALVSLGRLDEAAAIAQQSLDQHVARFGGQHLNTLYAIMLVGEIERARGDFEQAELMFRKVAQVRLDLLGDANSETFSAFRQLAELQLRMPGKERKAVQNYLGLLTVADEFDTGKYGEARRRADRIRHGFANAAWQGSQSAGQTTEEVEALRKEVIEDVLIALQRTQSNRASNALARAAALQYAAQEGMTDLVLQRETVIAEIDAISDLFIDDIANVDSQANAGPAGREGELKQLNQTLQEIEAGIRTRAPDYFAFIAPQPLGMTDIQTLLRAGEAAFILVPTDLGTHALLITDKGVSWHRSDMRSAQIDKAVKRLLWDVGSQIDVDSDIAIKWAAEGEGAYPYDFGTAHTLYRELVAPFEEQLKNHDHLYIAASGSLSNIPLAILVEEAPAGNWGDPETLRSAKWFGDRIAQIQLPNLQSLSLLRGIGQAKESGYAQEFIGFGDPLLDGKATERSARSSRGNGEAADISGLFTIARGTGTATIDPKALRLLSRLPGTAQELDAIWQFFGQPGDALFLRDAATETTLRQTDLNARVITFATHGLLAGEVSGVALPGLVMTPPDSASAVDDGYLSSEDIAALSINSEWVILSACNTAGGDGSGEATGLGGLARAFFFAGAERLLASHWPVRDDVAGQLTLRALQIDKENPDLSKAQALQQAMIAIRNDPRADGATDTWAHPSAWAPFVLVGDR